MTLLDSSANTSGMETLPSELHIILFSLLSGGDLTNASRTCKSWHRLICTSEASGILWRSLSSKYWRHLDISRLPQGDIINWRKLYHSHHLPILIIGPDYQYSRDVREKLLAKGFSNVELYDSKASSPANIRLVISRKHYRTILCFTDHLSIPYPKHLGDALKQFVDQGGGVVMGLFSNCTNVTGGHLQGSWQEHSYDPILPSSQDFASDLTLRDRVQPDHFILNGVESFHGGRLSWYCTGSVNAEAKIIARWSNYVPLVVELQKTAPIVCLNFWIASSDVNYMWWRSTTDGANIIANSLIYTALDKELFSKDNTKNTT